MGSGGGSWIVRRIGVALLFALAACRTERRPPRGDTESTSAAGGVGGIGVLVRLTVPQDSTAAAALADSLEREGWDARLGARPTAENTWVVSIVVPGDTSLAGLVSGVLRTAGHQVALIGPRPRQPGLAVELIRVNGGTHGMSARVRWTLSSDRRGLLVVEDPRSIENDPLPNAFVFAVEGAPPVHRDSVWDVAAAPNWTRVAYSRAYTSAIGEADSMPPSEWHRLAGQVGLMESLVRKNAFPTSGAVVAFGVARPFVVDLSAANDTTPPKEVGLPTPEGWRVAWTADGNRLALGAPPEVTADDAPSPRWRFVDPENGDSRGAADASTLIRPQWIEGPNLDISTAVDMRQRRAFRAGDVDVESEDGWIRIYARDGARLRAARVVGPGIALTATANGQFIVAIAPDPSATSYDPPNQLVVYHLLRK